MRFVNMGDKVYKINPNLQSYIKMEEVFGLPLDVILFEKEFLDSDFHKVNEIVVANYEPIEDEEIQEMFNTIVLGEIFFSLGIFNEETIEGNSKKEKQPDADWLSPSINNLYLKVLRYADMTKAEFLELTFSEVDNLLEEFQHQQRENFELQQIALTNVMGSMYIKDYEVVDPFDFLNTDNPKVDKVEERKNDFEELKAKFGAKEEIN